MAKIPIHLNASDDSVSGMKSPRRDPIIFLVMRSGCNLKAAKQVDITFPKKDDTVSQPVKVVKNRTHGRKRKRHFGSCYKREVELR